MSERVLGIDHPNTITEYVSVFKTITEYVSVLNNITEYVSVLNTIMKSLEFKL